jgi:hypothetical protein
MGVRQALHLAAARAVILLASSCYLLANAKVTQQGCNDSDGTCSAASAITAHLDACGLWLAPSSLPGAGLGMFAGRDFAKDELLQETGDVVIPIVDIMMHQRGRGKFNFLWDEYTWNGRSLGTPWEMKGPEKIITSYLFHALINSWPALFRACS